jgi:glycosidase
MAFYGQAAPELTMCFDFVGMQQMYLALARENAQPLVEVLKERPDPPTDDAHWATFMRNHDELTLDKLTEAQRKEVFDAFGPEPEMQLYGRGLRRRLPPMLDGDQRRIRLVYSMLFSLPGTPVLFYGEEIGMGEDLRAEGRLAVRTPMQWAPGPDGGFSTADASTFPGPVVEGDFGPDAVNVRDQERDPDSLLSWFRMMIDRYRQCPELAWGAYTVLDPGPDAPSVLAHRCSIDDETVLAVHNLTGSAVTAELALDGLAGRGLQDVLSTDPPGTEAVRVGDDGRITLPLDAYGFRWLRT